MTLSRKIFLPGVFVFSEEKPPYIARLLYETVTGLFSFLQALQNHHEKGGLFDGQRNYNLVKAGYKVRVISDCVTSYDLKKLDEMLAYYADKGCDVKKLTMLYAECKRAAE